ncbi:MAG TPA: hypothetical protein VG126_09015 [Thermoleophilaceae bacterium]|nr:hypothetical protein [Thermoleophilaceae bacterium]
MRLGFAVKVLGDGGMPSHDSRRWQPGPHLRTSLAHLRAMSTTSTATTSACTAWLRLGGRAAGRRCLPDARMHADLIDPIAFEQFLRFVAAGLDFDVMLEAKGKDLALMRLREQLAARGIRFRHGDHTPSGHRRRALVP